MLLICRTALHVSWTTRHPSHLTGKSWNVVPGEPFKDTRYINSAYAPHPGALFQASGSIILCMSRATQKKLQHLIHMQPGHSEDNNEARAMAISPQPPKGRPGAFTQSMASLMWYFRKYPRRVYHFVTK